MRFDQSIKIWGCFGYNNTGRQEIFDEVINSKKYIEVLSNKMLPSVEMLGLNLSDFIFQDDSAPIHRSRIVNKWKNDNNIESLEWCGNSPDLNPIENLWKILKLKIAKYKPTNKLLLKRAIVKVWREEIPVEICRGLIESMDRRCKAVLKNKGGHTKY